MLLQAATAAGFVINQNQLQLQKLNAGLNQHKQDKLPQGHMAVYVFRHNNLYLKVGKANQNSNARYQYQHYNGAAPSTLHGSLKADPNYNLLIGNIDYKDWIKANCFRYNLIMSVNLGAKFLHFAEAFFLSKYNPKF